MKLRTIVAAAESEAIVAALVVHGWNQCRTAKALGIHRNTLSRKLNTHHILIRGEQKKQVAKAAWMGTARKKLAAMGIQ